MLKKITFAAITAALGVAASLTVTSASAAPKPDDCRLVAKADRPLCRYVKGQFPYAYATEGGVAQVASGRELVHDITHQGLTKSEMRSYLRGEADAYRRYATGSQSIVVNLASLKKHHGSDAQYTVGLHDRDGKPGGIKDADVNLDHP